MRNISRHEWYRCIAPPTELSKLSTAKTVYDQNLLYVQVDQNGSWPDQKTLKLENILQRLVKTTWTKASLQYFAWSTPAFFRFIEWINACYKTSQDLVTSIYPINPKKASRWWRIQVNIHMKDQLVEHCISIAELMDLNPVHANFFFFLCFNFTTAW